MTAHQVVASLIVDIVPQWLASVDGNGDEDLVIDGQSFRFWSLGKLTNELRDFKRTVERLAPGWVSWLEKGQPPSATNLLQESCAIEWLRIIAPGVKWEKVLSYLMSVSQRTFENAAITSNLVISPGTGTVDISDVSLQKLVAPLAGSMQSFFRVDGDLRVQQYDAIHWDEIHDAEDYKLYPEFLHPFGSILENDDISAHHTSRGDLLFLKRGGLRAARRKGQWRVYDPPTLKGVVSDLLGNYWVGANAFEFLLDLSFKRHGALIVYDPRHEIIEQVRNRGSIIASGYDCADPLRKSLKAALSGVKMGERNGLTEKKRLMMEVASLDGALVFDNTEILAIGAMIALHPEAGDHQGARTTAALSALAFGAHPIKVSTDGDIDVYFRDDRFGTDLHMSLSFL
jgi:DisA bacterial checkpoint controller nucleotide-binding